MSGSRQEHPLFGPSEETHEQFIERMNDPERGPTYEDEDRAAWDRGDIIMLKQGNEWTEVESPRGDMAYTVSVGQSKDGFHYSIDVSDIDKGVDWQNWNYAPHETLEAAENAGRIMLAERFTFEPLHEQPEHTFDQDAWRAEVEHEKATLTPEQNADEAAQRGNYSVWDELEKTSISIHESSFGVVARENFPDGRSYAHLPDGSWAKSEGHAETFHPVSKYDVPERFKDAVETHEIKALDALLTRDIVAPDRSEGQDHGWSR